MPLDPVKRAFQIIDQDSADSLTWGTDKGATYTTGTATVTTDGIAGGTNAIVKVTVKIENANISGTVNMTASR